MQEMNSLDWVAWVLVIIGGVNWGLVGALQFNLVDFILGSLPLLARIVYVLVGVAALYSIYMVAKSNKK